MDIAILFSALIFLMMIGVFVLCLGIALLTPPVGIILFMVTNISGAPLTEVIKETIPFFLIQLVVLGLVAFVPFLSIWLPSLVGS